MLNQARILDRYDAKINIVWWVFAGEIPSMIMVIIIVIIIINIIIIIDVIIIWKWLEI